MYRLRPASVTSLPHLTSHGPGRRLRSTFRRPRSSLPPRQANPLFGGKVVCGTIAVACGGVLLLVSSAAPRGSASSSDRLPPARTLDDYWPQRNQAQHAPAYTLADFLRHPIGTIRAVVNRDFVNKYMMDSVQNFDQGRYITLLTHTFNHSGILHLAVNMWALWGFGPPVVAWYGLANFTGLWVASGVVGGLVSIVAEKRRLAKDPKRPRNIPMLGASASILGITVAGLMPRLFHPVAIMFIPIPVPAKYALLGFAGFSAFCEVTGEVPGWGHAAHLGGMGTGLLYYACFMKRGPLF